MDQLIVGALQKSRVDRHHRFHALAGEPRGEGHRVLLGDADVEIALRIFPREAHQARAFAHRRRNRDQALVLRGHVAQPIAENLGVGRLCARFPADDAGVGLKLGNAVVEHRIGLGQLVALALPGHHVQELRPLQFPDVLQRRDERVQVVAVDRADIVEPEFLEHGGRQGHALGVFLDALCQFPQRRHFAQHRLAGLARGAVQAAGEQPRQVFVEPAHRARDRHIVVIEHHQQIGVHHASVVHRFECHSGRHGAVADDRDRAPRFPAQPGCLRHAQRRRDRGAGVRRAECVVFAFRAPRKAGDAAVHAQPGHALAPPGENLVRIGLVAYVPHQPVVRRIEHVMQRDGEFHRPQIGRQMAAGLADRLDDVGAQLFRQLRELAPFQRPQLGRTVDGFQQLVHRRIKSPFALRLMRMFAIHIGLYKITLHKRNRI